MRRIGLWLRWSARDLRQRWLVVAALALVIAIGTGAAAAFGSLSQWRRLSNDASFRALGMHDLQLDFPETGVPADRVLRAVRGIPQADRLLVVQPALDVASQVEVVVSGRPVVLPGRVVGVEVTGGGPRIDRLDPVRGRRLTADDALADRTIGVLENGFAGQYRLPATGSVRVAGGTRAEYVGLVRSTGYLLNGEGAWLGEPTRAVLFLPLPTAQRITGAEVVNRVLITLRPGADRSQIHREVIAAVRDSLPEAPVKVTDRADDPTYRMLYRDIDNDQRMWDVIAVLVLGGAAIATFNLANRVITAQRREIGVGSALGLRPAALALRPLLFGAQVAMLGTIAGVGIGVVLGWGITSILDDLLPLPQWRTPFQVGPFARAAALGLGIPLLGVGYPVWRAVRMTPAEAVRTGHIAGRGGAASRVLGRLPLPGSSIRQLPVRHLLRAPGRTALTAAGIGASVAVLVAMLGLIDSFRTSMDRGERELARGGADRTTVSLDTFRPVDDPAITAIGALPEVAVAEPGLRLTGQARRADRSVDLIVDVLDFGTAKWTPRVSPPIGSARPNGVVLSEKAAADLGVRPGDEILIEHPRRSGPAGFTTVSTPIRVAGCHPHPMRAFAYLDAEQQAIFGLAGLTNLVQVRPAAGVSAERLRSTLLGNRAVVSVQPVTATSRAMRDMLAEFVDVLRLLGAFVLALALLIAFNAASISADERAREHATMLAFGLRTPTLLRNAMTESVVIGLLGTGFGLLAGAVTIWWMTGDLLSDTLPDLAVHPAITGTTMLTALAVGVAAVTIAPLLTVRRLRRTNIPAALRVVE